MMSINMLLIIFSLLLISLVLLVLSRPMNYLADIKERLLSTAIKLNESSISTDITSPNAESDLSAFFQNLITCGILMQNFTGMERFGIRLCEVGIFLNVTRFSGGGYWDQYIGSLAPIMTWITEDGPRVNLHSSDKSLIRAYNLIIDSIENYQAAVSTINTEIQNSGENNIVITTTSIPQTEYSHSNRNSIRALGRNINN